MADAGQHTRDYERAIRERDEVDAKVHEASSYAKLLIAEAQKIVAEAPEDLTAVMEVKPI
jgi:hypothetical protein